MSNRPIRTGLITMFASIAASIALCVPVLNVSLVSDDWVLLDAVVHKGVWAAWGGGGHEMLGFFRPLVTLSLWANMQIGGLHPLGYHLFNAVVHGLCGWLVGVIVWLLVSDLQHSLNHEASVLGPILASILFLAHPSHGEPVAWVSGRADLMACMFALAALAAWTYASKIASRVQYLSMACLVLALLSKEAAIALPMIVFAHELILNGHDGPAARIGIALRRTWPLFLILILFLMLRAAMLGHAVGGYGSGRILALNPIFWARNLGAATIRSFLPAIPSPGLARASGIIFSIFVIALFIHLAIVLARRGLQLGTKAWGLFAFFGAALLFAIIPIINLPVSLRTSEGERFVYFASAFSSMALALFVASIINQKIKLIAMTVVLIVFLIGIETSFGVWREAGQLAGKLVGDAKQITGIRPIEQLTVHNLPDHLRGAYVFRNGFVEAARLSGITPDKIKEIKILSVRPIQNVNEKFEAPAMMTSPGTICVNYSEGKLAEISR